MKKIYYSFDQANGEATVYQATEKVPYYVKRHYIRNYLTGEITGYKYTVHRRRIKK